MATRPAVDIYRNHPTRRPDWRWWLAGWFARQGWPCVPTDDPWIRGAHWVHVAQRRGRRLARGWEIVPGLVDLHLSETPARWELEARILAREPLVQIASRCGMPPRQVLAYSQLFFSVRDRLDQRFYMNCVVIRSSAVWEPTDVRKVWLAEAYSGGLEALGRVLDHYRRMGRPDYTYLLAEGPCNRHRDQWDVEFETRLIRRFSQVGGPTSPLHLLLGHSDPTDPRVRRELQVQGLIRKQIDWDAAANRPTDDLHSLVTSGMEAILPDRTA